MDADRFRTLVTRLEAESSAAPGRYKLKVAALAALGFVIMALLLGTVGLGLVLLAGLAVALAYSGGAALLWLFKLGKVLILLAWPMWSLVKHGIKALLVRLPAPQGRALGREQAPALFAALDDMRRRMHGPPVHQVLLVDEVNAAMVQVPAFGLFGLPRNHLLLGLPLLESLPPDEALAVVAHEYGHLAGSHGRFGAWIYRLRHTWVTIHAQTEQMQGWMARLVRPLVRWFAPHFNAYTFVLARANEYEADAASAELVGADAAAQALKRVNLAAVRYQAHLDKAFDRLRDEPRPPGDMGRRWAQQALLPPPADDAARWLGEALDREGRVDDTHPVLRARLAALPGQAAKLHQPPPPPQGPTAAEAWLGALWPGLREHFDAAWAESMAQPWADRHEQVQRDRQRLAGLRAQGARALDEHYEMLRLQTALEPEVDQRQAWADFNAEHPDHAGGLFFEGAERLFHGDATGLPLLERCVALDPDFTKPACERAHAWLTKLGDTAAAERHAERWRERDAWEARRADELDTLDVQPTLVTADAPVAAAVLARLTPAALKHVARVHLARRLLHADSSVQTYVLAVTLTWWGRQLGRQQAVVNRLAALDWPVHLVVCTLEGRYAKLKRPLRALAQSRLV